METTLKEIGISIKKGAVYLVAKIINAKIKITIKTVVMALLIIFFGFIAIAIIYDELDDTTGRDELEKWLNEEPTAEDWLKGEPNEVVEDE